MDLLLILVITVVAFALVMLGFGIWTMTSGRPVKTPCGGPSCQCKRDGKPLESCKLEQS